MENKFEELKEMIKYTARTKMQLKRIKTEKGFYNAVRNELVKYDLDVDKINKFLYNERNLIFNLSKKFKASELKNWPLELMLDEMEELAKQDELVRTANGKYSELTGKSSDFYNQYSKFLGETRESLSIEIQTRKLNGEYM